MKAGDTVNTPFGIAEIEYFEGFENLPRADVSGYRQRVVKLDESTDPDTRICTRLTEPNDAGTKWMHNLPDRRPCFYPAEVSLVV